MDYILSSANGKEQRHFLNSSIAFKARIPGRMEKTLNTSLPFFRLSLTLLLFQVPALAQETVQEQVKSSPAFQVEFVSQYPTVESKHQNKKLADKLNQILFGKIKKDLGRPVSMIVSQTNQYWILDQKNKSIFHVNTKKSEIPHYIEKNKFNLNSLVSICNFKNEQILFSDSYLNTIFLIDPENKKCSVLNDSLKLEKPTGIIFSAANNEIWVTETGKHRIVILNEKGEIKRTIGKRGIGKGEFNFPTHIWMDSKGLVYVVDAMNFRVQIFDSQGIVQSVFGTNGDATGNFASPKGIATDSYGNIYVADALFNAVQIFDFNGNFLYTFGSQGQDAGQFWMPSGIYIDDKDFVYVSDTYNSRVQIFHVTTDARK